MRNKNSCLTMFYKPLFLTLVLLLSLTTSSRLVAGDDGKAKQGQRTLQTDEKLPTFARPIIRTKQAIDKDLDRIQDSLTTKISQLASDPRASLPIIVTLFNPVESRDLEWFAMLGGSVTFVYRYVTYGFAGVIPAASIALFASLEKDNLCVIEYDASVQYHLDISVPVIGGRPVVWETYGYTGSPSQSIAIIDTGIDDSHPDVGPYGNLNFSNKMVGWYDATPDMAITPEDYGEHGTHVAGIAAGTGDANTLQTSGFATNTWTYQLSGLAPNQGWIHYGFDVLNPGLVTLECMWTSGNTVFLQLRDATGNTVLNQTSGSQKPLVLTYYATSNARYRPVVGVKAGFGSGYFSLKETYPYQGRNDGYNLFSGVAPTSKLVGVKVFDNTGYSPGSCSWVMAGMDWVIANKHEYNITVANMSLSLSNGGTDTTFDQKADTMVENGIVLCVSAGNEYPTYTVGSPGTAAYAITVAATNDHNGITSYSSNGDTSKNEYGLVKPDVAAPGGSTAVGNLIISADSNDVDFEYSGQSDYAPDDYQQFSGTSMASPHVAGLAALAIDALGTWSWTREEALYVKMIISMTGFETQSGEGTNVPLLNRGEKDNKEGYGRICADAAIEASAMTYNIGDYATDSLGDNPSDKKVWARHVYLSAGNEYTFELDVPLGADYDLYLYNGTGDAYGQPVVLEKSVNASVGVDEAIAYTPVASGVYYLVAKWVNGQGVFSLQSASNPMRDISILDVTSDLNLVYAGESVNVTVQVANDGFTTESFNVTARFENTTLGIAGVIWKKEVIDLASGANITLTFIWDTKDVVAHVNYVLKAEADVVEGEANVENNLFVDGFVRVDLPGDVNGDGIVNIIDLAIVARVYMVRESEPGYDAHLDLNHDGVIDIRDLSIIGRSYGNKSSF